MARGDARLDGEEPAGLVLGVRCIRAAGQAQLLGDHLHVRFADRGVVIFAVVGLVGQAEAGLFDEHDIGVRIRRVAGGADVERAGRHVGGVERAEHAGELGLVRRGVDRIERWLDRGDAGGLDGVGVGEGAVEDARLGRGAAVLLEDVADLVFGLLGELVEGAVPRLVVGQAVGVDPRAVDIAELLCRR